MIEKNSKSKIKMICFPFAGGHGNEFLRWQDYFEEEIEIVPLQLSGRGNRINEEFNENFVEVIKEILFLRFFVFFQDVFQNYIQATTIIY